MHGIMRRSGYALAPVMFAVFVLFSFTSASAAQQTGTAPAPATVYKAQLNTVNQNITGNTAKGTAQITIAGDEMTITLNAEGLAPDMMILAHLHGLPNGAKASCATMAADTNKDGFVDVKESEAVTGPPMIPLDRDPKDLNMKTKSYSKSDKKGILQYTKKVKISTLQKNFNKKFGMTTLPLENMVINLHGVAKNTKLPSTVQSEMKLPAYQTIPVACGEIKKGQ